MARKKSKNKKRKLNGRQKAKKNLKPLKAKTWRDLKGTQKYRVTQRMFQEYERRYGKRVLNGEFPSDEDEKIIGAVHYKFKDTVCWLSYKEVEKRYLNRKKYFRSRILKKNDKKYIGQSGQTELVFLGTGSPDSVVRYNTCFLIRRFDQMLLVDCGGGASIFKQLDRRGIDSMRIHHVFVSGSSLDHFAGAIWLIRKTIVLRRLYEGKLRFYGSATVLEKLKKAAMGVIGESAEKHFNEIVKLIPVEDGERLEIIGMDFEFFDLKRRFAEQMGFSAGIGDGSRLVFLGDENPPETVKRRHIKPGDWVIREAYCLKRDKPKRVADLPDFSTVEQACADSRKYGVEALILVGGGDLPDAGKSKSNPERFQEAGRPVLGLPKRLIVPSDGQIVSCSCLEWEETEG